MPPSATQEEPQGNGLAAPTISHQKTFQKARTYEKTKEALTLERKYAAGNYHPLPIIYDRALGAKGAYILIHHLDTAVY